MNSTAAPAPIYSRRVRLATLPVTTFMQAAASAAVIAPAVAAPRLIETLGLGPAAVGLFISLVYLGAMFASPMGAHVVRRWGPIRASQAALLCGALGLLLTALPSAPLAALGALVIGLGYGPITPASSQMLSRTTDPRNFSLVFSLKQTGVPLGGVIAGLLVPPLTTWQGPAAALWGMAAISMLALVSAWPLAAELDREREPAHPWPSPSQLVAPMRFVVDHRVLRMVALVSFIFSIVQLSLTSYAVSYLVGDLRWTLIAAGAALSVSQVASVAGRIAWGWVSDRWLGPRRMLLWLAIGMAVCSAALPFLAPATPAWVVIVLLCAYGTTAVGWNGVYLGTVARLVPQAQAATATAGTLFFTFFGVVIGPPLFGWAGSGFGALGPAYALLMLPLGWAAWVLARADWSTHASDG